MRSAHGVLISQSSLARPLSRQWPIEAASPVHVLPGSSLLLHLDCSCIRSLIVHMLTLRVQQKFTSSEQWVWSTLNAL